MLPDGRPVAVTGSGDAHGADLGPAHRQPRRRPPHRPHRPGARRWPPVLPDGRPVAVTGSRRRHGADLGPAHRHPDRHPLTGHTGAVAAVATALPDGAWLAVTGSATSTVRIWDPHTGSPAGTPSPATPARWRRWPSPPTAAWLASPAARRHGADLGPAHRQPRRHTLTGHTDAVAAVAAPPDGRPVASPPATTRTVRIWDLTTGTPIGDPLIVLGEVTAIAILDAPTGTYVVISGDGILALELRLGSL